MANYSLYSGVNPAGTSSETLPHTLGMFFSSSIGGWITHVRVYVNQPGGLIAVVYATNGEELGRASVPDSSPALAWAEVELLDPISITANQPYFVGYFTPQGSYTYTSSALASARTVGPLTAPASSQISPGNGAFIQAGTPAYPNASWSATWYGTDVVVTDVEPADVIARAGADQSVQATYNAAGTEGPTVTLDGSSSRGANLSYNWTQISGPTVTLSSPSVAKPTFAAPHLGGTLVFGLTVENQDDVTSQQDTVTITVASVPYGRVKVDGQWEKRALFVRDGSSWTI